jgi:type II secretory pathway pseudopilin PulG
MIRERPNYFIDVGIVVGVLVVAAAVAVPRLLAVRMSANEEAAMATLHNLFEAQVNMRQLAKIDADGSGRGEYAGLVELSGAGKGRMECPLTPPLLRDTLARVDGVGEACRIGYRYCVYLPAADGSGVPEPAAGFTRQLVDASLAETAWCAYAWPMDYPMSGERTFFINQKGVVLMTESRFYSGLAKGPAATAAFRSGEGLTGETAIGGVGADGHVWRRAD